MTKKLESPQNSPLREVLKKPIDILVKNIDKHSDLTPNQLSVIGAVLAISPILYKVFAELNGQELSHASNILLALISLSGVAIDGLDGSLARFQQSNGKANGHTPEVGQLVDGLLDRLQEFFAGITFMILLWKRGYPVLAIIQAFTTITNPVGSTVRAMIESQGKSVPENGSTALEFFGTRAGRVLLSLLTFLPKDSHIILQALAPILGSAGNIATNIKRVETLLDSSLPTTLGKRKIEQAKTRKGYYAGAAIVTALATIVTQQKLRNKN